MANPNYFDIGGPRVKGRVLSEDLAANGTVTVPKNALVTAILIRNNTANAVTGGIRVGTTAAGVDVHATIAVAASAVVRALPLIGAINTAAARTLYIEAVTAWNSASLDVSVEYQFVGDLPQPVVG